MKKRMILNEIIKNWIKERKTLKEMNKMILNEKRINDFK